MNAHTHAYRRPAETTLSQAGANMLGAAARFIASVRDMGLSRDEVAREVTKPFWRA
jgi:hypothetical protein